MVSLSTWCRYIAHKLEYSATLSLKNYHRGQITDKEMGDALFKNLFQGRLTYLHWNKGEEMAPSIGAQGGTLLVRKIPAADPKRFFVGDVVVLKDPEKPDSYLVRRLAAIEGYEMLSTDEKDEPFVLDKDECWVLADNENLKPKEANDSRKFGPVSTIPAGRQLLEAGKHYWRYLLIGWQWHHNNRFCHSIRAGHSRMFKLFNAGNKAAPVVLQP